MNNYWLSPYAYIGLPLTREETLRSKFGNNILQLFPLTLIQLWLLATVKVKVFRFYIKVFRLYIDQLSSTLRK